MHLSFENKAFIFVGGLHRSGTSFLAERLAKHSAISGFSNTGVNEDEGQFLQTVYPDDNKFGGPGRFAFDRRSHITDESPLISGANKNMIFSEWSQHWDMRKRFLLEKSPGNLLKSRFLQEIFQNSFFIFILRHPVAVSLATQKWSGTSLYSLIHHWTIAHELMRDDLPYLRKYLITTYEDIVRNPGEEMKRIFDFVELPSEPIDIVPQTTINAQYFTRWKVATTARDQIRRTRSRQRSVVRKAYNQLLRPLIRKDLVKQGWELVDFDSDVQDAIVAFEERVQQFGYSLSELDRIRQSAGHLTSCIEGERALSGAAQ